uniref:Small ribosomal subunit protein bS18c n=1 Tax=Pectinodesmus pectinatus TaxID=91197 RepID=A0A2H4FD14_9CHLO|nr:ribosomal protein S18 [Pectinodesmus pectinatus]AOS53096.1 ribosomal protein S18 [Pectinodesmus pectinatus]
MNNQSFSDFSQVNSNSLFSTDHTKNGQNENLGMTNVLTTLPSLPKQSIQKKQSLGGNGVANTRANSSNSGKYSTSRGVSNSRRTRVNQKKQRKLEQKKRKKPLKPIIPPKSFILLFKDKPEKYVYNRRIIDYKHCGLLQRYIGLGGKILPRRQTKLTAKQQRYVAKTIKSARIMGLLPFVTKERSFFR